MQNSGFFEKKLIVIIGTAHSELGSCNSDELLRIIHKIAPQVVFCEASLETFPRMLKAKESFNTPEIKALRWIIAEQLMDVIPVDISEDPFADRPFEEMHEFFRRNINDYHFASEIQFREVELNGFRFLNSQDSDQIHSDKILMEKNLVQRINNARLSQMHREWLQLNEMRENHWINVILETIRTRDIKKAVFLVGAAHRIRLIEKVRMLPDEKKEIINWDFYPVI